MKPTPYPLFHNKLFWTILVFTLVIIFGIYFYYTLSVKYTQALIELQKSHTALTELENSLASSTVHSSDLTSALTAEQAKSNLFSNQIQQIQGTVGTLVKLSKTDPELLKKYSKVYFLNENYIPSKLTQIDTQYLADPARKMSLSSDVWPFMQKMLDQATQSGIHITIASAYRSFSQQSSLKAQYKVVYGSGANAFSADQGYSEHQLGTTVDFSTPSLGGGLVGFEKTDAFVWLNQNAYKYGFIISYPLSNKYYEFEPWHWRFVGIALATTLHDDGKYFYDLDQRTIDPYLITLFDEQ